MEMTTHNFQRMQRALWTIISCFCSIRGDRCKVTWDTADFHPDDHVYDIRVVLGILESAAYSGLGLDQPGGNPLGWDKQH